MPKAKNSEPLVECILQCSRRYRERFLDYDSGHLTGNWWKALRFFYDRAFFQGRRDVVSKMVLDAAISTLDPLFSHHDGLGKRSALETRGWASLREQLEEKIGKGKVGKARDIDMTISALEYVGRLPKCNIVLFSVDQIKDGRIEAHFEDLQHGLNPKGIVQVGPKIAALYLRDIVSLYSLDACVPVEFQYCLQPVDVWVRRLARKVGIVKDHASDDRIRQAIVDLCKAHGCSALQFNQGAWYIGSFAFEVLLERLSETR